MTNSRQSFVSDTLHASQPPVAKAKAAGLHICMQDTACLTVAMIETTAVVSPVSWGDLFDEDGASDKQ